jgi:hypothetical protein
LRACAIAASTSARVLGISLETRRRLPGSFEPGLAGRPKVRTIVARFGFLIGVRPIFGIATPHPPSACNVLR